MEKEPSGKNLTLEQELIEIAKAVTGSKFIGDDCAVLPGGILISSDSLVEGHHFRLDFTDFARLGWKCLAVNISDIAAMAGIPKYALVSLVWPKHLSQECFRQFYEGLDKCARHYNVELVGGDLTGGSPLLVCSITIVGQSVAPGPFMRSAASVGDVVIATGSFGASACGLDALKVSGAGPGVDLDCYIMRRHLCPEPRVAESALLRQTASEICGAAPLRIALMDTSDGLADAVLQIASASNVGIEIYQDAIPVHAEIAKLNAETLLERCLYGGEDYELLATVPQVVWDALMQQPCNPFTEIGRVLEGSQSAVVLADGTRQILDNSKTFQHYDKLGAN